MLKQTRHHQDFGPTVSSGTRAVILAVIATTPLALWPARAHALTPIELLGKNVFFDTNLSRPRGKQACASCHDPASGWVFPNSAVNLGQVAAPGAQAGAVGSFKTPANAYATFIPVFQFVPQLQFIQHFGGGVFWDGRAEGCGKTAGPACQLGASGGTSKTITPLDLPIRSRALYTRFLGPTADQALNPFPNPVEQNIQEVEVCREVQLFARYRLLYPLAFGERIDCGAIPAVAGNDPPYLTSFKRLAVAISAYQASREVNSFSSKRDIALRLEKRIERPVAFPLRGFTPLENRGHDLFYGTNESGLNPARAFDSGVSPRIPTGNCSSCHNGVPGEALGQPTPLDRDGTADQQLYTDHRYHNIGVPFNPEIPGVGKGVKIGLQAHVTVSPNPSLNPPLAAGFFKTPTLRNVGKGPRGLRKAFAHNGWFKSLESIVHFYNTRDKLPKCDAVIPAVANPTVEEALAADCWPNTEFPGVAPTFGNNGLTNDEEAAIVAYLKTLSDLITPRRP